MGVYIKGMEMPKSCYDCMKSDLQRIVGCTEWKNTSVIAGIRGRIRFCPLVEVPEPHGRLIDADDVKSRMIPLSSFSVQDWISEVELSNCRTVIEAEE